jgi:ferredoxin
MFDSVFVWILSLVNLSFLAAAALFSYESIREQEPRAPKLGLTGVGVHLLLGLLILTWPAIRVPSAWYFGLCVAIMTIFLLPIKDQTRSLNGAVGYLAGDGSDFHAADERDIVFARNRGLQPGMKEYDLYYERYPEKKEYDDKRRALGGPLGKPGFIDHFYRPNVSMLLSSFAFPSIVGKKADVAPADFAPHLSSGNNTKLPQPADIDAARASKIVKGWAKHLGADLVGICKIDRRWAYSHRGEIHFDDWDRWGTKISVPLPYAVVVATEMKNDMVATAPHTPAVIESGLNYARGAYVTTILAQWFGAMGYRAIAQHSRRYDLLMVPLAIDAGLGELGRLGYLIAKKYGPRVRLFAVQTDMPLIPDERVDLGAEKFCESCLKCAESCPSKSISLEREKTVDRGIKLWKLNEETCFEYWGKVGTDCCVCMAICPYARPNRSIHKLVRWFLCRSLLARMVFPHIDNILYGRRWKPRKPLDWMEYPKGNIAKEKPALQKDRQ